MARYRMENCVVDTGRATQSWEEARDHDGNNFISRATGTQWDHETLYRSRKGRFYKECTSAYQGSTPHAEWVSPEEAVRWFVLNDHEVPEDLKHLEDEVVE